MLIITAAYWFDINRSIFRREREKRFFTFCSQLTFDLKTIYVFELCVFNVNRVQFHEDMLKTIFTFSFPVSLTFDL